MRGSLKLFTWLGIPVHLHWTFGLIFLLPLWESYAKNLELTDTLWLFGLYLSLFGCVLLHEYGHALTARRYGVNTQDIILTPIGGIARLERMPEKPEQEFFVAIAGPMVNVVIAIVLFGLGKLIFSGDNWSLFTWFLEQYLHFEDSGTPPVESEGLGAWHSGLLIFLPPLVAVNIGLVVFNLIPAFPMDGGRIFRALLAIRLGRVRATHWAARLGQAIAVLFIFLGVTGIGNMGITLAFIGFFVFITARTENAMVRLDDLLRRFKARDVMRPQFTRLQSNDWMQTPITLLQQGLERHFLVFDLEDRLSGVLEESDIIAALRKRDLSAEISQYAHPSVKVVSAGQDLQSVYQILMQRGNAIIAVADHGELIGVIDQTGLQNFLRLNTSGG
ncbi:MAG: site-2 protease family protein [Thermoanaerobaculia bacterium]|nr:site-2 protease family protein [Thermoanaerobaculia bacterium]